jgi:hypothetical protein
MATRNERAVKEKVATATKPTNNVKKSPTKTHPRQTQLDFANERSYARGLHAWTMCCSSLPQQRTAGPVGMIRQHTSGPFRVTRLGYHCGQLWRRTIRGKVVVEFRLTFKT